MAAWIGCIQSAKYYLSKDANINAACTDDGSTPLTYAVDSAHEEFVTYLLQNPQLKIDQALKDGTTPLMLAVQNNNIPMTKLLLAHGASIHTMKLDGKNVLDVASEIKNEEMIVLLNDVNLLAKKTSSNKIMVKTPPKNLPAKPATNSSNFDIIFGFNNTASTKNKFVTEKREEKIPPITPANTVNSSVVSTRKESRTNKVFGESTVKPPTTKSAVTAKYLDAVSRSNSTPPTKQNTSDIVKTEKESVLKFPETKNALPNPVKHLNSPIKSEIQPKKLLPKSLKHPKSPKYSPNKSAVNGYNYFEALFGFNNTPPPKRNKKDVMKPMATNESNFSEKKSALVIPIKQTNLLVKK